MLRDVTDEGAVREELMELQLALDLGEIDEDAYLEREAEIMERLHAVRAWRAHLGMDSGEGPFRLASPDVEPREGDSVPGPEDVGEGGPEQHRP